MQEEFFYTFNGFGGVPSKCHIRIVAETGKPIVVICSQPPDNRGTSVMNAYESIRDTTKNYLSSRTKGKKKELAAETLEDFAATLEQTADLQIAIVVFLLRQAASALKNEKWLIDLFKTTKPSVIWLEHWPVGTGLDPKESRYSLVSEDEHGSPGWERVDISSFAKQLNYRIEQLAIPASTFA